MIFGKTSKAQLATAHKDLRRLANGVKSRCTALKMDFGVKSGHRGKTAQNNAFRSGNSTLRWPSSLHNMKPSLAIHFLPSPIKWPQKGSKNYGKHLGRFYLLAGIVLSVAKEMKIPIRWGGDWDSDGDIMDQRFDDLAHWELFLPMP